MPEAEDRRPHAEQQLNDLLAKIQTLKSPPDGENYRAGWNAGRTWTRNTATIDQLECLSILQAQWTKDATWPALFLQNPNDGYTLAEWLHFAFVDNHGTNIRNRIGRRPNRKHAAKFWKRIGASEAQTAAGEYLHGFADGALEVWKSFFGQ